MDLDENVCLCFHVTRRKLENYLRVVKPVKASQLSECGGAGTGCGWCVPILKKMHEHRHEASLEDVELPDSEAYASGRKQYIAEK